MKIVDVAEFYADEGGGVKTYVNQKLRAGAERGHEVVVVAPGPADGEEERHGGRVIWVKGPPMPFDPRYYVLWRERRVHAILDRLRPDLVEGSSPWTGGWFTARWRGSAARALIFHSDPVATWPPIWLDRRLSMAHIDRAFGWYWTYLRALSRRFDATVVSGDWLAERLRGFGIHEPRVVPFGVDHGEFSTAHADPALRSELLGRCGLDDDAILLVGAGRHHPEKRWGTIMAGVARARETMGRPMGLVVMGDGPARARVERLAEQTGQVHVAGRVERGRLATTFASADALVHGSACETYGLVVAEALCAGLPAVLPSRGGAADLADPSYSETYPPGDAVACGEAICCLLRRDREALHDAAVAMARARIKTPDDHFDALFELYEGLARSR